MASRLRRDANGYWAPARGKPPVCPEGYMNHPTNPYRCIAEIDECVDREISEYEFPPCGCTKTKVVCKMVNRTITVAVCSACKIKGREHVMRTLGQ